MEVAGIIAVTLLIVAAALVVLALWLRSRIEAQTTALRQEMQALLSSQVQNITSQLGNLMQLITQQVAQVNQTLQQGVSSTGQLASQAQQAVAQQLQSATETLERIGQQLGQLQQAGSDLSQTAQKLETVLGGAKTRGTLGEVALERLLEDALPKASYETQYRFSSGAVVDAVVRVGDKIVPVDSKFPLDAYRRLTDGSDDARKDFARAVRSHAESIAAKYILPEEHTLDFALMFVPSESVYYELLMTEDTKGARLADYCLDRRVVPVSPNTLYAYLNVILLGLRGMQIEENAKRLLGSLEGLQTQLNSFAEVFERLGAHLRNTQQSYMDAENKLDRARASLEQMAQGSLPESAAKTVPSTSNN